MKRKILSMAKKFGTEISEYKSFKSDMGCQCFSLYVVYNCERHYFDYGYFIGSKENNLLEWFSDFLSKLDTNPNSYQAQ